MIPRAPSCKVEQAKITSSRPLKFLEALVVWVARKTWVLLGSMVMRAFRAPMYESICIFGL